MNYQQRPAFAQNTNISGEGLTMAQAPTYEELQKRVRKYEKQTLMWKETEAALDKLEREVNALYNCLVDGVAQVDITGKVTRINQRLVEIGGYAEGEIIGKRFQDLRMFAPESISSMLNHFAKIIIDKRVPPFEVEAYTKKGDKKVFEVYSSLIEDWGQIQGVLVIMREVTAWKETAQKLRQTEEGFRKLAEGVPSGVSIMSSDGTFEYLNPGFKKMFGYTMADTPDNHAWLEKAFPDENDREKAILPWSLATGTVQKQRKVIERVLKTKCNDSRHKIIRFRHILLKNQRQLCIYEDITTEGDAEAIARETLDQG